MSGRLNPAAVGINEMPLIIHTENQIVGGTEKSAQAIFTVTQRRIFTADHPHEVDSDHRHRRIQQTHPKPHQRQVQRASMVRAPSTKGMGTDREDSGELCRSAERRKKPRPAGQHPTRLGGVLAEWRTSRVTMR
jgi:hypothetical protein